MNTICKYLRYPFRLVTNTHIRHFVIHNGLKSINNQEIGRFLSKSIISKLTPCMCDAGHSGLSCLFLNCEWRIRNRRFGERFLFLLMLLGVFSSADPTGPPPHRPGASRGAGADHAGQRGESGCQPGARSVPTGPLHSDLCPLRGAGLQPTDWGVASCTLSPPGSSACPGYPPQRVPCGRS